MAFAMPSPERKWDEEHTREVPLCWVRYQGTEARGTYLYPAPSIRVCRECGRSRELCRCAWRD